MVSKVFITLVLLCWSTVANAGALLQAEYPYSLEKDNIHNTNYIIEVPNDKKNGDFSTNVAMELTKILRKNPRDIADPWYTGNFDKTYNDILEGCQALLNKIL